MRIIFPVVFFLIACPVRVVQAKKLTVMQQLSAALTDCMFQIKKERVSSKLERKNQESTCKRKLAQRQAKIKQLRSELMVYKKNPPNNTVLVVGISVLGTVAAVSVALLITSIYKPEVFGNTRGGK